MNEIREYVTIEGRRPFSEWFESLRDRCAKVLIDTRIANVERGTLGNSRSVGAGVFELKIYYGPGYRIYFGKEQNRIILLLCGGTKSGQNKDIKKAQQYWKEYRDFK